MGFLFFLVYAFLSLTRPWEVLPELESLRLMFWVGNIGLAVAILGFLARGQFSLLSKPELYLFFGFVAIAVASRVIAEKWLGGAFEVLEAFVPALMICALAFLTVNTVRKLRAAAVALILGSLVLVGMAITSYRTGWYGEKFVFQQLTDEDEESGERNRFGRLQGLGALNDPNDFAQALLSIAPLLWPAWNQGKRARNFFLVCLPTSLLLYAVFLSRSRGAVLALMLVAALVFRERAKRFRLLVPVLATGCLAVMLLAAGGTGGREISADDESAAGRLRAWRSGLQMLKSHPVTGVGYGRFAENNYGLAAHNSFVNCFAELGITGYLLWVSLLVFLHYRLTKIAEAARDDDEEDSELSELVPWARALRFALYSCLATAFFLSRTYAPVLYTVVGLIIALDAIASQTGKSLEQPRLYWRAPGMALASIAGIYVMVTVAGF